MSKISINKTTTTYLIIEIGIQFAVSQIVFDLNLPLSLILYAIIQTIYPKKWRYSKNVLK